MSKAKEVFEMAASLTVEVESGIYTAQIRHPHNGYYAGDVSQTSRSWSRSGSARRDANPAISHQIPNRPHLAASPLREL
jgi:hypothetical protein